MAKSGWGEAYFDHYEQYLGRLVERKIFEPFAGDRKIQILAYDGAVPGCRIFASLGLSHYAEQTGRVAEVFAPVDSGWGQVYRVLANALSFLFQRQMPIERGTSISGIAEIDPEFVAQFDKDTVYLTLPYSMPLEVAKVRSSGGTGSLFLAIFLSASEAAYLRFHGCEALEDLLESKDVDPYNLGRRSAVSGDPSA